MKLKRGDVREDGWRFWKRSGTKEHWFSSEDYDAKAKKALESQRAHYERNKEAVKKKTKAYKEKKKPAPKPVPYEVPSYEYEWSRWVEEDLPPDWGYRCRKSFWFSLTVSRHGVGVEIGPSQLYHCDFLKNATSDERGRTSCLVSQILMSAGADTIEKGLHRSNSTKHWFVDLTTMTEELVEDIKQSIVALIESSLSPHEGREWMPWQKFPDPEIEESGDLSLILRQRFDPLFDAPLSSFSGGTSPLHPKTDLF
jgi:hypothetical protein